MTIARPSLDDVYLRHAGRSFGQADTEPRRWQRDRVAPHRAGRPALHARARCASRPGSASRSCSPSIWLLLFGALFKRTADIPGFTGGSYIEFLTPGVVVMLAVSSAGWVGMALHRRHQPRHDGPAARLADLARRAQPGQRRPVGAHHRRSRRVIVIALSLAVGAHFDNGVAGVAVLVLMAGLLGAVFASLSNGVGGADPPARDADRDRDHGHAAARVPLLRADAAEPAARLDPVGRQVQPGQLGRRGRPVRLRDPRGLGPDRNAAPASSSCSCSRAPPLRPAPSTPTSDRSRPRKENRIDRAALTWQATVVWATLPDVGRHTPVSALSRPEATASWSAS